MVVLAALDRTIGMATEQRRPDDNARGSCYPEGQSPSPGLVPPTPLRIAAISIALSLIVPSSSGP